MLAAQTASTPNACVSVSVPNVAPAASPRPEEPTERIVARLASLHELDYLKVRIDEAAKLGVQVKRLDASVKAARSRAPAGKAKPFVEHQPAMDAVDPAELLDSVAAAIRKYVILDPEQADAAALWVAHTYLVDVFEVSPIAIINAPERACGKTVFQGILGLLSQKSLYAANASASSLFRSIECWGVTLLIDEADTFFRDNPDLHGLVNAGYKRGGVVLRNEVTTESIEPKQYSVYGAKSLAGIALERHLPDPTMSRGIVFRMRRKLEHETAARFRRTDEDALKPLGAKLARFAQDYAQVIQDARPDLPSKMSDRAQDNWEPLFAIAMSAGAAWVDRAYSAAAKMCVASDDMRSTSNDLLADIHAYLSTYSKPTIRTSELIEYLIKDEDLGWATYNRGRPLTPRQLANLLSAYQIRPRTVRQPKSLQEPNGSTPKGYLIADFNDAFARYLKSPKEDPCGVPASAGLGLHSAAVAATPQRSEVDVPGVNVSLAASSGQLLVPLPGEASLPADFPY